ncbi:hypothetical protein DFR86_05585 [Acidianus sulfidivorans JP7]|uniref:Uncharacterized protein n=1 Tax=Acidianus sulfidivorans JP7 TaxID=619593 RepID=A0A2U9IM67_9CREN|nr:hypothetical protein [Acidianus sulfidivorans]AWR97085.1 hypothetical protein DFR86_05585 [Acidianus sulfidivorans JP7]
MTSRILEEYYILGNKISIKEINNNIHYEIEEVKLNNKEKEILKNVSENDIKAFNLDPVTADRILYELKKKKFGKLTIPILDDKVNEITCFNYNTELYVKLQNYGNAITNIKYSSLKEILTDLETIFEKAIRRKNQLIFENNELSGIVNSNSPNTISFNILKKTIKYNSIPSIINSHILSLSQFILLWELLERKALVVFTGNIDTNIEILQNLLNLLNNYKILDIGSKPKLNIENKKYIKIDSRDIDYEDIQLYNPDIIIFDKFNKNILKESLKLNINNKGIIILSNYPDHYTFIDSLNRSMLLSLSKLPTIIIERTREKTIFYDIYSLRNKIKIAQINNIGTANNIEKLHIAKKAQININTVELKKKLINDVYKNNITDNSLVLDKINEEMRNNVIAFS